MRLTSKLLSPKVALLFSSLAATLVGTSLTWHISSSVSLLGEATSAWLDVPQELQPRSRLTSSSFATGETQVADYQAHTPKWDGLDVSLVDRNWKELTKPQKKLKAKQHWELGMADFFNSTMPTNFSFSNDTRIYFIHVGKAGGSTIYHKLGLAGKQEELKRLSVLDCHLKGGTPFDDCLSEYLGKSPTRLFRATVGHRHLAASRYTEHKNRWLRNNGTNTLLFTVRDPVARVVSAYNFHYQSFAVVPGGVAGQGRANAFFGCFKSIEELAQAGASKTNMNALSPKCRKLGKGFLKGTDSHPGKHTFAGFAYYVGGVWVPGRPVASVRTEFLEQDMRDLEQRLGGNPDDMGKFRREKTSKNFARTTGLTPEGKHSVCCWIVEEMPVFEKIIMLSQNLDSDEKTAYIRKSRRECGVGGSAAGSGDDSVLMAFSWKNWHRENCPQFIPLKDWFDKLF